MLCHYCFEDKPRTPCLDCDFKRTQDPASFASWVFKTTINNLRTVGRRELDEKAIERLQIRNAFGMKTCRARTQLTHRMAPGPEKFCNRCFEWLPQNDYYCCDTSDHCSIYCAECTKQYVKEARQ